MTLLKKISVNILLLNVFCLLQAQDGQGQYLKDIAPFPIGTSIAKIIYNDPLGGPIVRDEFNSLTPEFQMKIGTTNPNKKEVYGFSSADEIVDYATANKKRLHGHVLIYPMSSYPAWMQEMIERADSIEWEHFMKERIQKIINRYKVRGVKSWDVVAESFLDNGTLRKHPVPADSKANIWCQMLGDDYIARAFQYAHEADPEASLFYNDYGQEFNNSKKTDAIVAMVTDFKARGIPIHGLGLQMHTHIGSNKSLFEKAIIPLAGTGLLIHLSEVTIEVNRATPKAAEPTEQMLEQQKQRYRELLETMQFIPPAQRFGFTLWGVTDKRSYPARPQLDWPVLWNDNFVKKPAYDGVKEGLNNLAETTVVTSKADEKNRVWISAGKIQVSNAETGVQIAIYNLMGTKVYQETAKSADFSIDIPANGMYVIRIGNKNVKLSL